MLLRKRPEITAEEEVKKSGRFSCPGRADLLASEELSGDGSE